VLEQYRGYTGKYLAVLYLHQKESLLKLLSRKAKYGIKAMIVLGKKYGTSPVLISEIARQEHIPQKFLEAILLNLKHHKLLESKKGKGGGYFLSKNPREINMGEIIRVLDGPLAPVRCVSLRFFEPCSECKDIEDCRIQWLMKDVRDNIANILDNRSLSDVIR
jgi:Rrf2 family protein